jgi:hypothetical protein
MGLDTGSVYRVNVFIVDSVGNSGKELGYIRARDSNGILYDFKVNNRWLLPIVDLQPSQYDAVVATSNYAPCRARMDLKTGEYGPVGVNASADIVCELISRGVCTPPTVTGATTMTNNRAAGSNVPMVSNVTPTMSASDPNYDPNDETARKARAMATPGITSSPGGGISIGQGQFGMNISQKAGMIMNADTQTSSTQEDNHGGGMLTTSYNFLHHYFIGIANTVALPMPHMVNLIKMIAIGKFVKDTIGTKGKTVDGKWENGTGIFGLADEVVNIAKKK